MSEPLVIKFGGTSVGDGAAFVRAAKIAAGAAREHPVAVVVSAMSGTTDTLLAYAGTTIAGTVRTTTGATREGSIAELHRTLHERHLAAARESVSAECLPRVEEELLALLNGLMDALEAPLENSPARRAEIAVFGERLSATILSGAISSAGAPSAVVPEDPIATDGNFAEAEVDAVATRERCTGYVQPLLEEGVVAVVPGYVGRSPDGEPTTLGRGGSDLSATVLGRALGSREVWIMSDVNGVLNADPRLVPEAATLSRLSYREADAFAALGAKVLHPRTMEPAAAAGMEVWVRSTFDPDSRGTRVTAGEDSAGVRCVALHGSFEVELPCTKGPGSEVAAIVCIGSLDEQEAELGVRRLRDAGINPIHSGSAMAGLVYVVPAARAKDALRVLHDALVGRTGAEAIAGEVA